MKRFLLAMALCLGLAVTAQAEGLTYARDGEHHVTGTITADGASFMIDATLEENLPQRGRVAFSPGTYDSHAWANALRACFPESAEDLLSRLSQNGAEVSTADPLMAYLPVLPASENTPDAWLSDRVAQCAAFLDAVGVAYDAIPYCAAYTAPRTDSVPLVCMDASDRDKAAGATVCWLLAVEGTPVAVSGFKVRLNADLASDWAPPSRYPVAEFTFDMEGRLTDVYVAVIDAKLRGAEVQLMPWEEALVLALNDFAAHDVIRQNMAQFSYTVTDIRCVWDMNGNQPGRPGWQISVSAKSPSDASPTGWVNRYTTYFVGGER